MASNSWKACYDTEMGLYLAYASGVLNLGKGSKITSPLKVQKRVEDILQGIFPSFIASSFFFSS